MKKIKIGRWILIALMIITLYFLLSGKNGLINIYFNLYRPLKNKQHQIELLSREIDSLKAEKEKLYDSVYIEKYAREKMGMAKKGETIIKFSDNKKSEGKK